MKIAILDASTLGADISFDIFDRIGETEVFQKTAPEEVAQRLSECDVVIVNKIKLDESNLSCAKNLKLICVAATGFDNIDTDYCRENSIAVCNVTGYSSFSVAQVTVAMVLSLGCHLREFDRYAKSGEYTKSGIQNMLEPVYYELYGKTWGIIGMGNIGRAVAKTAEALGCRVIYTRRTEDREAVSLDTLLSMSDIISIHTPLTTETKGLIGESELKKCIKKPILVNVARGAVCDEGALTEAVLDGTLSGFGTDVYSVEPFSENHPYNRLRDCDNVILTPHMAWGAYESRMRCMSEIAENIKSFLSGGRKGRIV